MIFNNYYLIFSLNIINYIENRYRYIQTKSSIRKIKISKSIISNKKNNQIITYSFLLKLNIRLFPLNFKKFRNGLINRKIRNIYKQTYYENKGKIKIIGRGWKIIKYEYQLMIKLGYSHSIFISLVPYFKYKLKKKKKKYYIFYGIYYNKINSLMAKFSLMRIPDIYTNKGIFHRKIIL